MALTYEIASQDMDICFQKFHNELIQKNLMGLYNINQNKLAELCAIVEELEEDLSILRKSKN